MLISNSDVSLYDFDCRYFFIRGSFTFQIGLDMKLLHQNNLEPKSKKLNY